MAIDTYTTDGVELHFSRDEAGLVAEGLRALLNCRRFGIKEPYEDMRQTHAQLFELVDRVESQLKLIR
ncbi:MAG: hypothetical protein K1X71_02795 [Pirellulales bacterium]|nr:hypothetical protein [Pirellulales bacterium]